MIRVLVADDSAFMRKVLSDLFKAQPYFEFLGTAVNGKDAVEKVLRLKPDLLTMDVNMPVMDGLEATKGIREMECGKERHIPIVAMTGDVDEDSIQSCLDAGMDQHVGKPINREELARAMVSLL